MIPYGCQDITQADIDAVISVLKSNFLTQGPVVPKFEKCVASHVGSKHAIAVNSATSALHIACLALGLGSDDWLWTSPITFVASANCGLYCGARVDFVDIDPHTNNLCPQKLEEKLIAAEKIARLPKILIAVHLSGHSCDMKRIYELSKRFSFKIIEDASHAIGGKYNGEPIGNCRYSDITVFSFHPVKIITTAEGGMAVTNLDDIARKMILLRSHGITREELEMTHKADGPWYYQQIELGYNYRITELQAALGISQMQRLDDYVAKRHELSRSYDELLAGYPVNLPIQSKYAYTALHLYVIRLHLDKIRRSRREVFDIMRQEGIGVNLHYIPLYSQPYYQLMGFKASDYPEAERYYAEAISLPMFQTLKKSQQLKVVNALKKGNRSVKLALGTAQLGLDYGVANKIGRVSFEEAQSLLMLASQSGLDLLDTAISYGDSENILELLGLKGWKVVTKLPSFPDNCVDLTEWVTTQIECSIQRLGISKLYGLLLHQPRDLFGNKGTELYSALQLVKSAGLVSKIGVSIYEPQELDLIYEKYVFDLVQAPLNILDRRLIKSGWLDRLKTEGVEVHARSLFMQGLLLMSIDERPTKFEKWNSLWCEFDSWLMHLGLTPLEACLGFVNSLKSIDKMVVGVDSTEQFRQIINLVDAEIIDIPDFDLSNDFRLINPATWSQI